MGERDWTDRDQGEEVKSYANTQIRPFSSASMQMRLDRAMLERVETLGKAVFRTYRWRGPAISLGRSNAVPVCTLRRLRRAGIEWVRRPTGGGILVHGFDASFAVAVPQDHPAMRGSMVERGRRLAAPVLDALRRLGYRPRFRPDVRRRASPQGPAPLCFLQESPLDILVKGRKVAAFAQRVTAGTVFQHGSVMVKRLPVRMMGKLRKSGIGSAEDWAMVLKKTGALADSGAVTPRSVNRAVREEAVRAFPAPSTRPSRLLISGACSGPARTKGVRAGAVSGPGRTS